MWQQTRHTSYVHPRSLLENQDLADLSGFASRNSQIGPCNDLQGRYQKLNSKPQAESDYGRPEIAWFADKVRYHDEVQKIFYVVQNSISARRGRDPKLPSLKTTEEAAAQSSGCVTNRSVTCG